VREGIPTGSIGVSTRNIHSPVEVTSLDDMADAADFLVDAFGTLENHF
jgi:putative aminopeptidase FrvX